MSKGHVIPKKTLGQRIRQDFHRYKLVYLIGLLCLVYYVIFCYMPMGGVVIAFKDFRPARGIFGSKWANPWYKYFDQFFNGYYFGRLLRNTLLINLQDLVFGFPAPILLALLLNELRSTAFKRTVQTVTYLPHFISQVVVCGFRERYYRFLVSRLHRFNHSPIRLRKAAGGVPSQRAKL